MKLKILGPLAIAGAVAIASAFGTTFADGEATDADLTLTKEVSDASVEVGETVTFTLTVSNEGPATSTAVTLTDPLPAGLGFVSVASDSGVCGEASGVVTCNFGQLAVGEMASSTIVAIAVNAGEVTNTATVFGAQNDPNVGDNSDSATVEIGDVFADLSIEKAASNDEVSIGDIVVFTLQVRNNGPATSTNVVITDSLPSNLDFLAAVSTTGSCDETGNVVTCELGDLGNGEGAVVFIDAEATAAGEAVNVSSVEGDELDPDESDNTASATVLVIAPEPLESDLSIEKAASNDEVSIGDIVVFTLQVRNNGPATSTNVVITDSLPSNLDFLAAVSTTGSCDETGNVVTCELGDLGNGEGAVVFIDAEATAAGEAVNVASVAGDELDPEESDNTASATVLVNAPAPLESDLSITKTASDNHVLAGEHVVFTIQVLNMGLGTSTDVVVTDALPSRLAFVSAVSTTGVCGETGNVVICELGDLADGEGAEILIEVEALRSGTAVNTAEVSGNETDADDSDNSDSASIDISALSGSGIDIKPGSDRNPLNLNGRGLVPVLLFGGDGFDVHDIDISTLRFGFDGDEVRPAHGGHISDLSGDGIDDLMLHFRSDMLGVPRDLSRGDVVTLTLTGEMTDGTEFQEEDTMAIVGNPRANGHQFQFSEGGPEHFSPGARGKSKGKSKGPENKGPKGRGNGPRW